MDEERQSRKYRRLFYVEFLEFLCRLAFAVDEDEAVAPHTKVFSFLETLQTNYFTAAGIEEQHQARQVAEPEYDD